MVQGMKLTAPAGKVAQLFRNLPNGRVQCTACARRCQLSEGQVGFCGVRGVFGGALYLLVYGKVMAGNIDPIEKKPLVHYRPGSKVFSIATSGCSWACGYCFDSKTPVLTDRGIATIGEIFGATGAVGEVGFPESTRVLSHTGEWRLVTKAFRHPYRGKMLALRPYYLPEFRCTPNHKIFQADRGTGELLKVRADKLAAGDFLAIPKPRQMLMSSNIDTAMVLLQRAEGSRVGRVPQLRFDGLQTWFAGSKKGGIPRLVPLNSELSELFGLYCAEGSSIRSSKRPNSWTVTFSFGAHEVDLIRRTEGLLRKLFGVEPYQVRQANVTRVAVGSSELGVLFTSLMGGDCYSKTVPELVLLNRSEDVRLAFLRGYMRGDGYETGSGREKWVGTTSVSQSLGFGVWYLMLQLGLAPRFYTAESALTYEIEGRTVNRHRGYLTRILVGRGVPLTGRATKMVERDGHWLVPIRAISESDYEGYVYNLEVEVDHSYTTSFISVSNCQNSDISQLRRIEGVDATPDELVENALAHGCEGMAYTYNQPTIFMEFARDVGTLARSKGLFNVFVSNGYDTPETVAMMDEFLDCVTVDFKGSGENGFARKYISIPDSAPIFQSLLEVKRRAKVHVEITDLIVPRVGDSIDAAERLCRWVYDNLGPDTPIHFLRFHPDYKMMDLPPTPVETLEKHVRIGRDAGLNYVYIGNVPGHHDESTYCPGCGRTLIKRYGYEILEFNLDERSRCVACGYKTPIVGPLSKSFADDRFSSVIG